ncbi:MAG: hypothetical protein DWQ07_16095 [Chloroflexi bacterium]|nr:MAG: hypothetical protein DWQ07_16095 [Chloroflexota bacterium]MBL1195273.1 hypothetical protein [Chloroflexota bacterium]NOH12557.1 hypothetical protein [Chloroflexota bacterium]
MDPLLVAALALVLPFSSYLFLLFRFDQVIAQNLYLRRLHYLSEGKNGVSGVVLFIDAVVILFLDKIRWIWLIIEYLVSPMLKSLFGYFGVTYIFFTRVEFEFTSFMNRMEAEADRMYNIVSHYLSQARVVKVGVGEMGHRLMDNPKILSGVKNAIKNNNAHVEIVHGPRVDPKTIDIYELAEQGAIDIFMSQYYFHNHFLILELINGETIIVDEGVHDETLWKHDAPEPLLESMTRNVFIFAPKVRLRKSYLDEYTRRTEDVIRVDSNPGFTRQQKYSWKRLIVGAFLNNLVFGRILQPLSILFNWPIKSIYRSKFLSEI